LVSLQDPMYTLILSYIYKCVKEVVRFMNLEQHFLAFS